MLKKLKSIFIIEEEGADKTANTKAPKTSAPTKKATAPQPKTAPKEDNYVPPTSGKPDEKFVNLLLGAIDKNNLDGFDYLEYKQAMMGLGNVEMDEKTKYVSALAMAKTMGATKDGLVSSARHYMKVLEAEERKFLDAFKNQQNAQVNAKNQQKVDLEKSIALKTKKIEELTKEIEKEKQALESHKSSLEAAVQKVKSTKDSFYIAYQIVQNQIKDDLVKIGKYLS